VSPFVADTTVVAGAIARSTLLVATFGNTLLEAFPVIAEETRRTWFFGQLGAIIIADMNGGGVLAGNQAGLAHLQVLASSTHAYIVKGALLEAGPAGPVLGADCRLVAHTSQGPRQALILNALALEGIAPLLFETILISKTFDTVVGQFVAEGPGGATSTAGQNAILIQALAGRAISILKTLDANLLFLPANQTVAITVLLAFRQLQASPFVTLMLGRTIAIGHAHDARMGEGIADSSFTVFVSFAPRRTHHDINRWYRINR
jgi:hypothetical protein